MFLKEYVNARTRRRQKPTTLHVVGWQMLLTSLSTHVWHFGAGVLTSEVEQARTVAELIMMRANAQQKVIWPLNLQQATDTFTSYLAGIGVFEVGLKCAAPGTC